MLRNKGIWGLIGIIGLSLLISGEVMGKEPLKAEALEKKGTQTIEEKYVRKELISFTWGTGTYQLGSNWRKFYDKDGQYIAPEDSEDMSIGPRIIKVNKKGEILIDDYFLNKRTLIFDPKNKVLKKENIGLVKEMCFDENNNLYVLITGIVPPAIQKYDTNFNVIDTIYLDSDELKLPPFIRKKIVIGKDRNICFGSREEIFLVNPKSKRINKKIMDQNNKQKIVVKVGEGEEKLTLFSLKSLKEIEFRFDSKDKYYIPFPEDIIGEDHSGNIYLLLIKIIRNIETNEGEIFSPYFIQKYTNKGKFLTKIALDRDHKLWSDQDLLIDIDEEGNIYHLWIKREGPKLIKWERQK